MANVLKKESQLGVLRLLLEGNSIRSVERITGVHRDTVCRLVVKFGKKCQEYMDREFHNLTLRHIEVDEIWTFVGKKQARLTLDEKIQRHDIGDIYLWTALDQDTKLIATFAVGKRSADMARRLMVDLRSRLVIPKPHEADNHAFGKGSYRTVCQISTDGFAAYPEAVDLAFGPYVKYGRIIKQYRNATMDYTPSEMIGSDRKGIFNLSENEERSICTSHVERHNGTIRTLMKRFTRLTLGFSKKLENLVGAVSMFMAYYNYCWRTRYPDKSGRCGRFRPTAAMLAG